jgi:hypothetical protein
VRTLDALAPQLGLHAGDTLPPPYFERGLLPDRERLQPGAHHVTIGQTIWADVIGDGWRQNLLGSTPADTEKKFECRTIDKGPRKSLQLLHHGGNAADPDGRDRHGGIPARVLP